MIALASSRCTTDDVLPMDSQRASGDDLTGLESARTVQVPDKEQILTVAVAAGRTMDACGSIPLKVAHGSLTCPCVRELPIDGERRLVNGDELVGPARETADGSLCPSLPKGYRIAVKLPSDAHHTRVDPIERHGTPGPQGLGHEHIRPAEGLERPLVSDVSVTAERCDAYREGILVAFVFQRHHLQGGSLLSPSGRKALAFRRRR